MRASILTATLCVTALSLTACSDNTEQTAPVAEADGADAGSDATDGNIVGEGATVVMDANAVTEQQLVALDGMTPDLAQTIVAGQPYASVTDLDAALTRTLSREQADTVLRNVFVPVDLNTASDAELRLIPGMTERMEHEFKEYRPYTDISQFDREIGKYVDEEEVARFRNYVTLDAAEATS
ncbi:hypothetical protein [Aurantiacibacter spongiae]|uniref:Helix-hairpin-helix domain-containing protein n=1 Tax=Aurantiacibacter spongiae TaxID=2488860 RepID=A0A3N5CUF5_9SPHN|nr:hypothetical protein [Aurantiacibacter spongiae]RPF70249.1 hypothetical protein EG799_00345 [Aurantiacibacter spongiae]